VQVLFDPASIITGSSFIENTRSALHRYVANLEELVSSGVFKYQMLGNMWRSFQVMQKLHDVQTEVSRFVILLFRICVQAYNHSSLKCSSFVVRVAF
jgi:hypothetical protein